MKYKIQIQVLLVGMYFKYKYKYFEKYLKYFPNTSLYYPTIVLLLLHVIN